MPQTETQTWNLDSLYKEGSQSLSLRNCMGQLVEGLADLKTTYNSSQKMSIQELLNVVLELQLAMNKWIEIDEFLLCIYAANVKDTTTIALMEESAGIKSMWNSLQMDLNQTMAQLPNTIWNEFKQLEEVQPILFYLEHSREATRNRLPVEMEKVINALGINGIEGWEQQHQLMLSKLKIPVTVDGKETELSIGQALNQAIYSRDPLARQNAAEGIEKGCKAEADTFASVLNRIAGSRLEVYSQRGWTNIFNELLEQNHIDENTIHVMIESIAQNKSLYQAYIQRKFEIKQLNKNSWFELDAPLFALEKKITYSEAKSIIIKQFYQFSEKLGRFAEMAFEKGWIETESRPDKAEGGFCASLPVAKESRIFLTFRDTYQDVVTLAHELGHAYHNSILHDEPAFSQQISISVDETASTFAENLVLDAVIEQAKSEQEKLAFLEMKIKNGLTYVGTVPNMFHFEQNFYERRKKGPLTVEEIKGLLFEVENDFYGGIINNLALYKWMYISHFYDAEKAFYNIPYTIGYLLSNGIYTMAKETGSGFVELYDELLRNSGRMSVEQLVRNYLHMDVVDKEFWDAAQRPLVTAIEEYLDLTEEYCLRKK